MSLRSWGQYLQTLPPCSPMDSLRRWLLAKVFPDTWKGIVFPQAVRISPSISRHGSTSSMNWRSDARSMMKLVSGT